MQNEREQELFFRGDQIATAIERYQKKNGGAAPPTLEVLVKGKFLRKAYTDPMTKDGKWRFIRVGEVMLARARAALPGRPAGRARVPAHAAARAALGSASELGAVHRRRQHAARRRACA